MLSLFLAQQQIYSIDTLPPTMSDSTKKDTQAAGGSWYSGITNTASGVAGTAGSVVGGGLGTVGGAVGSVGRGLGKTIGDTSSGLENVTKSAQDTVEDTTGAKKNSQVKK